MTITRATRYEELPEFLTISEAAAFLGCKYQTLRIAVRDGEINGARQIGKRTFIPRQIFDIRSVQSLGLHETLRLKNACACQTDEVQVAYELGPNGPTLTVACASCDARYTTMPDEATPRSHDRRDFSLSS